jgi:hypothetical protein
MSSVDQATQTQMGNIEKKTGHDRQVLFAAILGQNMTKHNDMVAFAKQQYGLGYGDANTLVHMARRSVAPLAEQVAENPLDALYVGAKAHLRTVHEALQSKIDSFGPHEISPKKGYVSLRRKKQFAMLGPKTNTSVELGLNLKEDAAHPLVKAVPPGGMCQYAARLGGVDEIDDALIALVRRAYDLAG